MSSRHSPATSGSRPSWRDRGARPPVVAAPLRPWRWFLLLIVLGLAGLVVWLVWERISPKSETHLVAMNIAPGDPLALPPLLFADRDVARLVGLDRLAQVKSGENRGQKHAEALAKLGTELSLLSIAKRDVLIQYLAAHGGTEGDGAYIACSDYPDEKGRHPLRTLLQTMIAAPGSTKLLVLNLTPFDYDPREGVAANDLAVVVDKELTDKELLKNLGRQELWVLLSCAPLERPLVSYADRQSVFGLAVAEALEGKADSSKDGQISLRELYGYVFQRCQRWFDGDTSRKQTPLLMKAGVGLVDCGKDDGGAARVQLLTLKKTPPKVEAAPTAPGAEKAKDEKAKDETGHETKAAPQAAATTRRLRARVPFGLALALAPADPGEPAPPGPVAPAAESKAAPVPEAGAKTPTPAPQEKAAAPPPKEAAPAPPPPPKPRRPFEALEQVWLLRDALEQRARAGLPSPIDFAPHQWRKLNALLLRLEQECLEVEAAAQAARSNASGVETAPAAPGSPHEERRQQDLVRRLHDVGALLKTLKDALEQGRAETLPDAPSDLKLAATGHSLAAGWKDYLQALHERRLYHLAADGENGARRRWRALVSTAVDVVDFRARAATPFGGWEDRLLEDWLKGLASTKEEPVPDELDKLQVPVDLLLHSLSERILGSGEALRPDLVRNDDWLRTPLLRARERTALLNALVRAKPPAWNPPDKPDPLPTRKMLAVSSEERLALLRLEQRRLELAGLDVSVVAGTWEGVRQSGEKLRSAYKALRGKDDATALLLLDPRDAPDGPSPPGKFPLVDRLPEVQLAVRSPPPPVPTKLGEAREVVLLVRAWPPELGTLTPQWNKELLDVQPGKPRGDAEYKNGLWEQEQVWLVTAKRDATAVAPKGPVTVKFVAERRPATAREPEWSLGVKFALPEPNVVELALRDPPVAERPGGLLEWPVFPHRVRRSAPPLEVINRSGAAKRLEINLYALPPFPDPDARPAQLGDEVRRKIQMQDFSVLTGLDRVATANVEVGVGSRQLLEFGPVSDNAGPADAKEPKRDSPGATPPKEPPAAGLPAGREIRGLVCELRWRPAADKTAAAPGPAAPVPGERWLKGLEPRLIKPDEYVSPAASYDADPAKRRVTIVVPWDPKAPPRLLQRFPPAPPVHFGLTAPGEPSLLQDGSRVELDLPDPAQPAELYATVKLDGREHLFGLTVDEYPRAFLYRVLCGGQALPEIRPARATPRIHINRLEVPERSVQYHLWPWAQLPSPEEREKDKQRHVRIEPGQEVVLASPVQTVRVHFEVDVPDDAFTNPDDRIELKLGTVPATRQAPRMVKFYLHPRNADRPLGLSAEVADWSVTLKPGIVGNLSETLRGAVRLATGMDRQDVAVRIDGDPPQIEQIDVYERDRGKLSFRDDAWEVPKGAVLTARVIVRDFSGPAEVASAVSGSEKPPAEFARQTLRPERISSAARGHTFDIDLDSKDLAEGKPQFLQIKVWDRSGQESPVKLVRLRVLAPAVPPPASTVGILRLRVAGPGGARVIGAEVKVIGPDGAPVPVKPVGDDTFETDELPLDTAYTVQASGTISNRERSRELRLVKPTPRAQRKTIPVTL